MIVRIDTNRRCRSPIERRLCCASKLCLVEPYGGFAQAICLAVRVATTAYKAANRAVVESGKVTAGFRQLYLVLQFSNVWVQLPSPLLLILVRSPTKLHDNVESVLRFLFQA